MDGNVLEVPQVWFPAPENTLDITQVWYPQPSTPTAAGPPMLAAYEAPSGGWSLIGFASEAIPLLEGLFPFLYAFFASFGAATPKSAPGGGAPRKVAPPPPPVSPPVPPPPPGTCCMNCTPPPCGEGTSVNAAGCCVPSGADRFLTCSVASKSKVPPLPPFAPPGPAYQPPTVKPPSPIRIASVYGL